jgi:hypothetical protein
MWYDSAPGFEPLLAAGLAAAAFALLACMAGWLATRPLHAIVLICALALMGALQLQLSFTAGVSVYPEDLVFGAMGLACLVRFTLFCSPAVVPRAWWVLGAVQLLLMAWGIATVGRPAGVDARGHIYLWTMVLYCCSFRWDDATLERLLRLCIGFSLVLCTLVGWRWINCLIDPAYEAMIMQMDSTGVRFRVVSSINSFIIATGALGLLYRMLKGNRVALGWPLLVWQLLTVLILQHRSVWVSVFIGILCLAWAGGKRTSTPRLLAGLAMLVLPLAILAALPSDDGMLASVKSSADAAMSTKEGTMVGRVQNWDELLEHWWTAKDPVTWLLGRPYGSGYNPQEMWDGEEFDMVPHNHFMHTLYRGGLIGLGATLWVFASIWIKVLRAATRGAGVERSWAPWFLAALTALYAFCIPYWASYDNAILLGVALGRFGVAARAGAPVFRSAPRRGFAVQALRVARFAGERK